MPRVTRRRRRFRLSSAPEIAVGDGALSFWRALDEVFPGTAHQGCWIHKIADVLDKVPKSVQPAMKADLREIHGAPTWMRAEAASSVFIETYGAKFPRAAACLTEDQEALLEFYDFSAHHLDHLRSSNLIGGVFVTVLHCTVWTQGELSATIAKPMASVDLLEQLAATLTCFSVKMAATTRHEIIVGDSPDGEGGCYA